MKITLFLSTIAVLAALALTGCNKNSSDNSYNSATNSVTDGTGGMMNTNLPPTNSVPDLNRNAPPGTNQ